jgi:hypothetical protein
VEETAQTLIVRILEEKSEKGTVRLAGLFIYLRFESVLSLFISFVDSRLAAINGVTFKQVQSVKVHSSS